MSEFWVGPIVCRYDEIEARQSNGLLENPARLFIKFYDEQQDVWAEEEISWGAMRALSPSLMLGINGTLDDIRAARP
jgi:hypothetical protein